MTTHMHREMVKLMERLFGLADVVQLRFTSAIAAVLDGNLSLAQDVIQGDDEIDRLEVDIEEECLKVLALYQPVATDLRVVVTVLKGNNDLERIGDIAVHIAERTAALAPYGGSLEMPINLKDIAAEVQKMLGLSIRALMQSDTGLARDVCHMDAKIDEAHGASYRTIAEHISVDAAHTEFYLQVLSLSRYLERIADLATNIAEDVLYLVEGSIMRHHKL